MICCFYAWWKQRVLIDEFNKRFSGFLNNQWEYDHSEYPDLIRDNERFCLVAFGVFYFFGLLIMMGILIRGALS